MTLNGIAVLFAAMVVLASIPSVSVLTVSARSATSGFIHGAFTTFGIVVGDVVFILIAILGLSVLADAMGPLFVFVKYLGAAYLIGLGVALWRSKSSPARAEEGAEFSLRSSFLTGLFITLGDQKAILFYMGFFPAFFDLSAISYMDAGIIIGMAIVSVGGVKLVYAYMADRAGMLVNAKVSRGINRVAGSVMISAAVFVVAA